MCEELRSTPIRGIPLAPSLTPGWVCQVEVDMEVRGKPEWVRGGWLGCGCAKWGAFDELHVLVRYIRGLLGFICSGSETSLFHKL